MSSEANKSLSKMKFGVHVLELVLSKRNDMENGVFTGFIITC